MGSNINSYNNINNNNNQLSSTPNQACAACKHQRRKCTPECPLAPFFPPDQARRFQAAHKVYGVSNVLKILNQLDTFEDKKMAVQTLCWDAEWRIREPVYGCMAFHKKQQEYFRNELHKKSMEVEFYKKLLHSQQRIRGSGRNPEKEGDFMQSNAQNSQNNPPQDHNSLLIPSMEMVQPHYYHPHFVHQGVINPNFDMSSSEFHDIKGDQRTHLTRDGNSMDVYHQSMLEGSLDIEGRGS